MLHKQTTQGTYVGQDSATEFTTPPVVPAGIMTNFDQAAWLAEKNGRDAKFWERRRKGFAKSRAKKRRRAERNNEDVVNGEMAASSLLPSDLADVLAVFRTEDDPETTTVSLTPLGAMMLNRKARAAA